MATDLVAFCEAELPRLYAEARAALEAAALKGDVVAGARLSAIAQKAIHTRLRFSGDPSAEVVLCSDRAGLTIKKPSEVGAGFGYAVEVSRAAATISIGMVARGEVDPGQVARALLVLGSERACSLFTASRSAFDVTIERVPVLGTSMTRLAFGTTELPQKPEFSVLVEYDELEDAREQGVPPHMLFLAGKMRVDGDASAAMRLAMTLSQLA